MRDWTLIKMNTGSRNYVMKSFYIKDDIEKTLVALSVMTGMEKSLLVNEAIGDLVKKYQPLTAIDLLEKIIQ